MTNQNSEWRLWGGSLVQVDDCFRHFPDRQRKLPNISMRMSLPNGKEMFLFMVFSWFHLANSGKICQTEGCKSLAKTLLALINQNGTVDPCNDFYALACGRRTPAHVDVFANRIQQGTIDFITREVHRTTGNAFQRLVRSPKPNGRALSSVQYLAAQCANFR